MIFEINKEHSMEVKSNTEYIMIIYLCFGSEIPVLELYDVHPNFKKHIYLSFFHKTLIVLKECI